MSETWSEKIVRLGRFAKYERLDSAENLEKQLCDRWTDRQTDKLMDGKTNGGTDGQTKKQVKQSRAGVTKNRNVSFLNPKILIFCAPSSTCSSSSRMEEIRSSVDLEVKEAVIEAA